VRRWLGDEGSLGMSVFTAAAGTEFEVNWARESVAKVVGLLLAAVVDWDGG
jgi:hypothetical protein